MHPVREKMNQALKTVVVPALRKMGFTGSFPHFRRLHDSSAELLSFQFYSSGGSFVVELAKLTQEQVAGHWRTDLDLKTAVIYDSISHRRRLGAPTSGGDNWFVYGKRNYEPGHERVEPNEVYERVATKVVSLLETDAEPWWGSQ